MSDIWDELWRRWDKGEVDPFALVTCSPDFIKKIRAEGDDLSHTVKALRSWLNDYCKVCLKLVTDCEDCNYGGFKDILGAEG